MTNPLAPGGDLDAVEIDEDGTVTNVYNDGTEVAITASDAVLDRQRARGIATQSFLKRKTQLWPRPRI